MVGGKILLAARTLALTYIWIMKACLVGKHLRVEEDFDLADDF